MKIDGSTQVLGLLGHHISHTLSPDIHNFSAQQLGINTVYLPLSVAPEHLETTLKGLWHAGAQGFNITMPHKLAVGKLVTGSDVSVNTLYRKDHGSDAATSGGFSADVAATSTDGEGFCRALAHLGRGIETFSRLVLIGSGGANRALVSHCVAVGLAFDRVTVLRRSPRHDQAFKELGAVQQGKKPLAIHFAPLTVEALTAELAGSDADTLLVQGTSAPLQGEDLAYLTPGIAGFNGTFIDLVYGTPSALFHERKAAGAPCQDGLPMLVEQARIAQGLWWGQSLGYDQIMAHLSRSVPQP